MQRAIRVLAASLRTNIGLSGLFLRDLVRVVAAFRLLNRVAAMPAGASPAPTVAAGVAHTTEAGT
jgi:hypothetical protein